MATNGSLPAPNSCKSNPMNKPFSQACENNRRPILDILMPLLTTKTRVLEIGSGTGQHAVWFAQHMPHLIWQTSDLPKNHPAIRQWISDYPAANLLLPLELDMLKNNWPSQRYDAIFTANTAHIMPWEGVANMFTKGGSQLQPKGLFCLYGPIGYGGTIVPQSNIEFDWYLRQQAAHQGIRQFEDINQLAITAGLTLLDDYAMPANNRLLVWQKH